MELEDFIKETVMEISTAVIELNEEKVTVSSIKFSLSVALPTGSR
ncbi:hypothetical protein AAH138_11450 [Bacteroides thetaiotaomicron]|nr:hypothetical protein [Bacteroides thetaiotaomicron]